MTGNMKMSKRGGSVLIINVARIGDTLFTSTVANAIKHAWPACRIRVLAHPKRMAVLRHLPSIDTLKSITKRSAPFRAWLGGQKFDYALVYGQDDALLRYALRAAHKVVAFRHDSGVRGDPRVQWVEPPPARIHMAADRLLLAEALGIEAQSLSLQYCVSPREQSRAQRWWQANIPPNASPVVGLQVASFPTKPWRDWPTGHFMELIGRICAKFPSAHFIILGAKESIARSREIKEAFPGRVTMAAGKHSLRASAAIMQRLDLYIGVDTGPTHLAGAMKIPMVGIYHHKSDCLLPCEHPLAVGVDHPLGSDDSRTEDDMADITVDAVWRATERVLDKQANTLQPDS